jgi:hypothetical protein
MGISQTSSIIGSWKFVEFISTDNSDTSASKMLNKLFAGQVYDFTPIIYRMKWKSKIESGYYTLNSVKNEINLTRFNSPKTNKENLIRIGNDTLLLGMSNEGSYLLVRTSSETPIIEIEEKIATVAITKADLTHKWALIIPASLCSDSLVRSIVNDISKSLFKEISRTFKDDGTYIGASEGELLKSPLNGEGTWKFGPDNKSIIIDEGAILERHYLILEASDKHMLWMTPAGQKYIYKLIE